MVLEYINKRKKLKWCVMQNVCSVAILVGQLLFLHSLPDKKCESSFASKVTFSCIEQFQLISHQNIPNKLLFHHSRWSVSSVIIHFGGILCFGVSSAGQLFYTNIAKKQTNLITNVIYVFQFCLNLHSIYLGRSEKLFLSRKCATQGLF